MRVLGKRGLLVVRGEKYQRIARIAEAQRGRVARRQLLAVGITDSMIHHMLKMSRLHRLHAGVYAVGHLAPIELGRETAALLACRSVAVLSHHSAAAVWGIRPANRSDAPVHVTVAGSEGPRRTQIQSHRTTSLHRQDVRIRAGLPLTSPARTLLDIALDLTTRQLEWALDEALTSRIMTKSQLGDLLARTKGRRGGPILDALLAHRTTSTLTRSDIEDMFLALMRSADLPLPEVNVKLHGFLIDFLWRDHGVVFEVDSYRYHSSRSAFERDRRKDSVLKSAGLDVNRVSDFQLEQEAYVVVALAAQRLAIARTAA